MVLPGACVVFYEVPGGREVLTGEVSTHSWKNLLDVFLWDFSSATKEVEAALTRRKKMKKRTMQSTNWNSLRNSLKRLGRVTWKLKKKNNINVKVGYGWKIEVIFVKFSSRGQCAARERSRLEESLAWEVHCVTPGCPWRTQHSLGELDLC